MKSASFPASVVLLLFSHSAFAILDTNNNGLSDFWEKENNGGELFAVTFDPQADPDNDGWTNAQEAVSGTNPFDPNPPDGLISPATARVPEVWEEADEFGGPYLISPETVTVSWPTLAGKQYTLWFSPDLTLGSWLAVGEPFVAQGGEAFYGFDISGTDKSFWRVSAADVDSDGDGLTDHEESLAGTNAHLADSDGDSLGDRSELIALTNPLAQDSDGDGIPDLLDSEPLVSAFAFPDADGDGIADSDDAAPGEARGPSPSLSPENVSGNPISNLVENETVRLVFTVNNPGGALPTASELVLFANGLEETATITPLGDPGTSSQRFLLTWDATTAVYYPLITLQHLSLRFRDAELATSWINLARIDVAEWEGKIITLPFVSSQVSWGYDVFVHFDGLRRKQHFVSRNNGSNSFYRGPKSMVVIHPDGSFTALQLGAHAIPFLMVKGSPEGPPAVLEQKDYAAVATGLETDYIFNNGSAKSLKFSLAQVGIDETLAPGETGSGKVSLVDAVFPFSTFATISYLDTGDEWQPFHTSTWPVAAMAGANSRLLRSTNIFTNSTNQLQLHGVPNYLSRDVKITPHAPGIAGYPGLPLASVSSAYDTKYMPMASEEWRKIVIRIYPPQEHFSYSSGYRLTLGTGATGGTAPQTGWLAQTESGGILTPLAIPSDGKLEIPATDTTLYPQLTSPQGLVLFLKRDTSVDQGHNLSLDILPKVTGNSTVRLGALNLIPLGFQEFAANTGFDNYERFLAEQKLDRPWLSVPDSNKVLMLRDPAGAKLHLSTGFVSGKLSSVTPGESQQSPETLTVSGGGQWRDMEFSYECTLNVEQSETLKLAVYKKRTRTLAVHAITLTNDDVDSGIKKGEGKPNTVCIRKGQGQGTLWTSQTGGDDVLNSGNIDTGPDGICDTHAIDERDEQVIPVGNGEPNAVIVEPGPNGVLNTAANDLGEFFEIGGTIIQDDSVLGETITTGADGVRETSMVKPAQTPINVPDQALIQETLDRVFGDQANIHFIVKPVNEASVAFDVGDQAGAYPQYPKMSQPNGRFDFFLGADPSPEETLVKTVAYDAEADFNLYYFGSQLSGFTPAGLSNGTPVHLRIIPSGYARSAVNSPYVRGFYPGESLQNQDSAEVLASIGAHELAHNDLFLDNTGLAHPREPEEIEGAVEYVPRDPGKNFTLKKEADDRKRLMWPNYSNGVDFPGMLIKDDCDRLHGITTRE